MYQLLWIFFVYAFLGWCAEVSYAALTTGRFVNRGFLNGPACPIYGLGVVLVLSCLTPLKECLPLLFLGSVVLASLLEWTAGFLLERLFHQRWWDYSDEPFNLGGYICLRFSVAWGVACLLVVEVIHPTVRLLIGLIPRPLGWALLGLLGLVMAVDLTATVRTIARINRRLAQIDELATKIRTASDELGEHLADRILEAAERGADWKEELEDRREDLEESLARHKDALREDVQELREDLHRRRDVQRTQLRAWKSALQDLLEAEPFGQRRLLDAFPKMRSLRHRGALEHLRRYLKHRDSRHEK